jgi:RimJ/RimL family protein N-acetyltransferase
VLTELVRFDSRYSSRHVLADGTAVTLRLVQPSDRDELARQFGRMSPDSRYRRFFSGIRELSPEMLDYLTVVDGRDHFAIIAFTESLDLKEESGVGIARFVRLPNEADVAEAAVTVVDDHQGRGIGRILLAALVDAAQERGVKKFRGEVLTSNEPMCKLLEAAGATGKASGDGTLIFDVPIDTDRHTQAERSLAHKILSAVATSMAVWLSRLYPPGRSPPPRS